MSAEGTDTPVRTGDLLREALARAVQNDSPSMVWGLLDLLEERHPDVLAEVTPEDSDGDWQASMVFVAWGDEWNTANEQNTLNEAAERHARERDAVTGLHDYAWAAIRIALGQIELEASEPAPGKKAKPPREKKRSAKRLAKRSTYISRAIEAAASGSDGELADFDPLKDDDSIRFVEVEERREILDRLERSLYRVGSSHIALVGRHGVGKTSLLRGLARRVRQGRAPDHLKRVAVIPMASLVDGGERQRLDRPRLKNLLAEARGSGVILCLDDVGSPLARSGHGTATMVDALASLVSDHPLPVILTLDEANWARERGRSTGTETGFQPIMVPAMAVSSVTELLREVRETFTPEDHQPEDFIPGEVIERVAEGAGLARSSALPGAAVELLDGTVARARTEGDQVVSSGQVDAELGLDHKQVNVDELRSCLTRRVLGQDEAIGAVARSVAVHFSGLKPRTDRPLTMFLAGPTGVGKTELALALAEELFGSEDRIIRFDMAEYAMESSVSRLVGADPGLVGHDDAGQRWGSLESDPRCLLLFDEIEKAHPAVVLSLLSPMDEGTLTLSTGHPLDLSEAVFVFTSNLEADDRRAPGFAAGLAASDPGEVLAHHFPAEWVNRLDLICEFQPLDRETVTGIVEERLLADIRLRLRQRGVTLRMERSAIEFLVERGFSSRFGARELFRTYERELLLPLSQALPEGGDVTVTVARAAGRDRLEITTAASS